MRIVHFSDIHVGAMTRDPTALLDKRVLGLSNYFLRRHGTINLELLERAISVIKALLPDIVVCTGDITCIGSPEEFRHALALLRPLAECRHFDFIYIPGNHDTYTQRRTCSAELEAAFRELNRKRWTRASLPVEYRHRNLRLFIVDECRPTHLVSSAGYLASESRDRLQEWFNEPRSGREGRVLVGHYPLRDATGHRLGWRRELKNGKAIHDALQARTVDVALCGHIHDPFCREESSGAMEICAGSLTVNGTLNVLDFTPATGRFSQRWETISSAEGTPIAIPAAPLNIRPAE